MKKIPTLTLLLMFLFVNASFCQSSDVNDSRFSSGSLIMPFSDYDGEIKGTKYLQKKFQTLTISRLKSDFKGKYNALQDHFEIQKDNHKDYFLPSKNNSNTVYFVLSKKTYKAFEYTKNEKNIYGFFRISAEVSDNFLLIKEQIKFVTFKKAKTAYDEFKPAKFTRKKDTYYLKLSTDSLAIKLPTKKRKFLKVFGDKSKSIKTFIKKNRLSIKKEKDLIKIFEHFSSL